MQHVRSVPASANWLLETDQHLRQCRAARCPLFGQRLQPGGHLQVRPGCVLPRCTAFCWLMGPGCPSHACHACRLARVPAGRRSSQRAPQHHVVHGWKSACALQPCERNLPYDNLEEHESADEVPVSRPRGLMHSLGRAALGAPASCVAEGGEPGLLCGAGSTWCTS